MSILIVGAGPVGLALATDLGWRGIECHIIDQRDGKITHPKMNTVGSRTMEFCRRWGIAEKVKDSGFPLDFPRRSAFVTNLDGYFLYDYDYGTHAERQATSLNTPEVSCTCPQTFFDPILKERAAEFESVHFHYSTRLDSFEQHENGIRLEATNLISGERQSFSGSYLIGCDGANSRVRELAGIELVESGKSQLNFNVIFESPDLIASHDKGRATMFWLLGQDGLWATLRAVDGTKTWRLMINDASMVAQYQSNPKEFDVNSVVERAIGKNIPFVISWVTPWARRSSMAAKFRQGRVLLAGDAAHQLSPTGGFGMNTGIQEAVDLGWKLAAVEEGWAPDDLLNSYEIERKPVAAGNIIEAGENARKLLNIPTGEEINKSGLAGEKLREKIRTYIRNNAFNRELETEGLALGYRYDDSSIVVQDGTAPPPFDVANYVQSAKPGGRAPHFWLSETVSILDHFGRSFVLLCLDETVDTRPMDSAAKLVKLPLEKLIVRNAEAALLYGSKLTLVRPDGHVAWRGDELPTNVEELINSIRGCVVS